MPHFQNQEDIKRDKILGSLWGAVLGDVIGAFLEFDNDAFDIPGGGKHKLEPGQPTDDSELNYAVCRGLIRGKGRLNVNYLAQQMGNWFLSKPIDIGNTIRNSVPKACNMKIHQAHLCRKGAKQKSQTSQSNGTLMALVGLSLWCHNLKPKSIIQAVRQYTILVHPNQLVVLTNCAYSLMVVYYLKNEEIKDEKEAFEFMTSCLNQNKTLFNQECFQEFDNWLNVISESFQNIQILQKQVPITKFSGWVRVAFSYAVHFGVKENNFKKCIQFLISSKGDTDTNASIAGGLLGAKLGFKNLLTIMSVQIQKIQHWRPKKNTRPEWMVPGLVIAKIAKFICQTSPEQLIIIGSNNEYLKQKKK